MCIVIYVIKVTWYHYKTSSVYLSVLYKFNLESEQLRFMKKKIFSYWFICYVLFVVSGPSEKRLYNDINLIFL